MEKADKEEIKELISQALGGLHARTESKFDIIDLKLESILTQTTKHNHRMSKIEAEKLLQDAKIVVLEKQELLHDSNCPQKDRVRKLEDEQLSRRSIRSWVIASSILASTITGIILGIMKLIGG